jgi:hypothetical protein
MTRRSSVAAFVAVCVICILVPVLYVLRQRSRSRSAHQGPAITLNAPVERGTPPAARGRSKGAARPSPPPGPARGAPSEAVDPLRFLYRNTALGPEYGALVSVTAKGRTEYHPSLPCERVHYAAGTGVCLMADRGFLTTYWALIFDDAFDVRHRIPLAGGGSRTRVAPNGKRAAVTVFVSGHSYTDSKFSTQTTIIDTTAGTTIGDVEQFEVLRDGAVWKEVDFNFWGVTFAKDSNLFYATLLTGGKTYLVRGDVDRRRFVVVREGVECPSLSPDGSTIAFKKVVAAPYRHWILAVLDLATMQETVLTETRSVNDQVDWLDDDQIVYGLPESETASSAVVNTWLIRRSGQEAPRLFVPNAASLAVVRDQRPER